VIRGSPNGWSKRGPNREDINQQQELTGGSHWGKIKQLVTRSGGEERNQEGEITWRHRWIVAEVSEFVEAAKAVGWPGGFCRRWRLQAGGALVLLCLQGGGVVPRAGCAVGGRVLGCKSPRFGSCKEWNRSRLVRWKGSNWNRATIYV
jgi:hypothetical protein